MQRTRRRVLQAGAALSIGTLAGCLSSPNSGSETTLDPPMVGNEDAPVLVESYEDFTCKYCRLFHLEIFPQLFSEYVETGAVQFKRRDYPFLDPEWSWKAASAARAVQDQQDDATFFEYANRLYQNFDQYDLEMFATQADSVGADPEAVRSAVRNERYLSTLEAEKESGNERNVSKTPTVFVNGSRPESPRYVHLKAAIESELESSGD